MEVFDQFSCFDTQNLPWQQILIIHLTLCSGTDIFLKYYYVRKSVLNLFQNYIPIR